MTLKESDGIFYRDGELLLSRVRGLSEAKPSCPAHGFVLKQRLSLLDIPRFLTGTAKPLPASDCFSKMIRLLPDAVAREIFLK